MKYVKGEFITIPNKSALRGLSPNLQVVFLWLCDHSDDNMKSFPSRQTLANECGIGLRTLDRSMQKLVELGYVVKSTRTNKEEHLTNLYEVVIFDNIPTMGGSVKLTRGGSVKLNTRVASKKTLGSVKKDTENSNHLTQPIELNPNITNVIGSDEPATYGKPEINELFSYWQSKTSVAISAKRQANRNACNNLYKRYGDVKLRQLIDGVALAQTDKYAPRISDFCDLQAKLTQLLTWGKAQKTNQKRTIKI